MRIRWDEPGFLTSEADITAECTREEAIARQKIAAAKHNYVYKSDQEALEDFLAIHWAWIEEDKE